MTGVFEAQNVCTTHLHTIRNFSYKWGGWGLHICDCISSSEASRVHDRLVIYVMLYVEGCSLNIQRMWVRCL